MNPFFCKSLLLPLLLLSLISSGQNTISIKKSQQTFDAIFQSIAPENKTNTYYCFKKNGYVYSFNSNLKEKEIIQNCQEQQWLKSNSIKSKYIFKTDSIAIFPISYSVYSEETINGFYFQGLLDSTQLQVTAIGQQNPRTFLYQLLLPLSLVIED